MQSNACGVKSRDEGTVINAITLTSAILAAIFYCMRIFTRTVMQTDMLGWDDLFLTMSMVCMAAQQFKGTSNVQQAAVIPTTVAVFKSKSSLTPME